MKPGDILLFRGGGVGAKLIQWGTDSPYSHCGIAVFPEANLFIEAQGTVRGNDIRQIKRGYDIFRVKEEYSYDLDKVISFLVDKLNRKYDYAGVVFLGILKLLRLKETANKWQKDRDYFCSELLWDGFIVGGLNIVPDKEIGGTVSPADIALSPIIYKVAEIERCN